MKQFLIIAFFWCVLCFACTHSKNGEKPIARVFDKYLYPADLEGLIPIGTSKSDSILIVKNFINDWMQRQVLVASADENVDVDKKELEKKINDYKESILIFEYENELVRQKLDTVVSEKQIDDFYNQHKDDYLLHNDIIRANFVKIPNSNIDLMNIKRMMNDPSISTFQLNNACKRMEQFSFDDNKWTSAEIFPTILQNSFPKTKGYIEQHDSLFTYLIQLKEFLAKENTAPKNYVKDQIVKTILNQRKVMMIKKTRSDLINETIQKGEFEILN